MYYKPNRIILWNNLSEEMQDKICLLEEEITDNKYHVEMFEGELLHNGINIYNSLYLKYLKNINLVGIYISNEINNCNYCYYNQDNENKMFKIFEKNGINLDEISMKFNDYMVYNIIT